MRPVVVAAGVLLALVDVDVGPLRTAILQAESASRIRVEQTDEGCRVLEGDQTVLFYRSAPNSLEGRYARAGYVHPLYGLDGEVLTQEFPADHRHHHGVFWAWHQIDVGGRRVGDGWTTEDFLAVVKNVEVDDRRPDVCELRATAHWTSPNFVDEAGTPRPFVEEHTTIRVHRRSKDLRLIDFEIRLRGLVDGVRIGGAENERGYSGFTVRLRPPEGIAIFDEHGPLEEDAVGSASRWVDVTGRFREAGKSADRHADACSGGHEISGVAILSHRTLPEFPPKWLLRFYGMQNVVWPGREPVTLPKDRPAVLRHRLAIHRGQPGAAGIARLQAAYENAE